LANPYIRRWHEPAGFAFIGGFGSGAVHGGYRVRFGGSLGSGYRYGGPAPGSDGGSYTGDILPGSLDWWCRDWRWPDSRIVAQDDSISTGFVDPRLMPWLVVAHDDESQSLRGQAREFLRRGRYPEAIGAITLHLTEEPDDVLARRDLAIMQIGAGEISSGIDTYHAAVMVDPTVLWLAPTGSMLPGGSSQLAEFAGSVLKVARQDGSVSGYFVAAALYSAAGNRENGLRQLNEANARGFDFGVVQIARRAFTPSPWVRTRP